MRKHLFPTTRPSAPLLTYYPLTCCSAQQLLHLLYNPFDLVTRLVQLLLMPVYILSELGTVEQAVSELEWFERTGDHHFIGCIRVIDTVLIIPQQDLHE